MPDGYCSNFGFLLLLPLFILSLCISRFPSFSLYLLQDILSFEAPRNSTTAFKADFIERFEVFPVKRYGERRESRSIRSLQAIGFFYQSIHVKLFFYGRVMSRLVSTIWGLRNVISFVQW